MISGDADYLLIPDIDTAIYTSLSSAFSHPLPLRTDMVANGIPAYSFRRIRYADTTRRLPWQ